MSRAEVIARLELLSAFGCEHDGFDHVEDHAEAFRQGSQHGFRAAISAVGRLVQKFDDRLSQGIHRVHDTHSCRVYAASEFRVERA